ncbi:MAG: polyprenol monophosphomannose synthase [Pirellulales bacterium]|nr:polyprenol monophosphomannose synthase [Pirellulales bacterium]
MIERLRLALPAAEVLVVDDDSSDGTGELVAGIGQRDDRVRLVVRHGQRGLGGAIRHAMELACEGDYDFLLNLDADLSHDPAQLPAMLRRAVDDPQMDVVIGSRYVGGGAIDGWPLRRRLMSRMVNGFATTFLRLPVRDCSGSMRCYRVEALRRMQPQSLTSNGYSVLEEVLVKLHRQGGRMSEVPITFTDRVQGQSKLTTSEAVRSAMRMITLAWKG